MEFQEYFPIWKQLTIEQQELLQKTVLFQTAKKGTIIHNGNLDCAGLLLIRTGQLRAYILSEEGREITIYRLFDRDICLFSASCVMRSVQFEVFIETQKDAQMWVIPPHVFQKLMKESAPVANYVNELMATRLSDVMWLMEQVMWKSLDKRLAEFLLEEATLEDTNLLKITHEAIANHLGSHREVITRMLRYFQSEDVVRLSRGSIEILNSSKLETMCQR